jgi:hypothetical protein
MVSAIMARFSGSDRRPGLDERLHVGVGGGGPAGAARHAEGGQPAVLEGDVLHAAEEAQVLGIGAGPAPLDVVHAEGVQARGQPDLVLH